MRATISSRASCRTGSIAFKRWLRILPCCWWLLTVSGFKPNIPLQEIKARYPTVRELRMLDTADPPRGVDQLRSAILDLALGLDHVGQRRPASWAKASEIIRTHPDPYLETPKFLQLLERAGVPNPADYAEQ